MSNDVGRPVEPDDWTGRILGGLLVLIVLITILSPLVT